MSLQRPDKQDRAGRADLYASFLLVLIPLVLNIMNTAKTFYAASIFFDVLTRFGELAPDVLDSNESNQTNFSSGLSSDQIEQDLERDNYSRANVPSQPAHRVRLLFTVSAPSSRSFDIGRRESFNYSGANPHASSSPSPYSSKDYSTSDYPQFPQPYSPNYHQSYSYEQPPFAQNYSPEISNPSSYPNFQSYPSFQESSFPSAPTHQPSYYHGTDLPYSQESTATPSISNYQSVAQYSNPNSTGNQAGSSISPAASYKYDSNYQPPVEKIAEAHKAARFAVGALAFDDVPVAVDFLRRSLELLTNPSAKPPH
ncbi:hypothetical protein MA16_Dca016488 [Dendrobium catenatum]|uniref:Vta1 C-terminal domain-containing protein n=1 Tax=Dendrobium catenatum TaxID=906689 RepID=A0A2I0VYR3_9ASPA|nr:hypothetical protein MA16_Dca016488 [Dendrobium catenatum]